MATISIENPNENYHRAPLLAEQYRLAIEAVGGKIDFGLGVGEAVDMLLVTLPDDVDPVGLLPPNFTFSVVHGVDVAVVPDQGVQSDEEPKAKAKTEARTKASATD